MKLNYTERTMLAVHLEGGCVAVRNQSLPFRREGFALIRLLRGGICSTDLEMQRGYYGFCGTPGHEFVGEVTEAGDTALIGRRVVGEINLGCGACQWCLRSMSRHCSQRTVLGIVNHPGAFAEYLTLPERNLHVVPDSVTTESAVFAEPLAAACEILDQVSPPCGAEIAVLGDGKLGLLIALVLAANGYRVRQFGRHREKLSLAEAAGVQTEVAGEHLPRSAYDWVVEATGSSNGLRQAVEMVRPRGTIILKSTVHDAVSVDTAPVIVNEVTLVGSRCGRFEPALRLLENQTVRVDNLISDCLPLSEAPQAFARAAEKGVLKVLLK